jgi:aarF domain-containing kinase
MSTLSAFSSPLLRRTWTCRACIQSQRQTISQRQTLWQQRGTRAGQNSLADRIGALRAFASGANESASAAAKAAGRNARSSRRRRKLVLIGGGLVIGAAAVAVNEDARHVYVAAQRSYRVVSTLVLNIREYVCMGVVAVYGRIGS